MFLINEDIHYNNIVINWWKLGLNLIVGLVSGYAICYSTYFYTCSSFNSVIDLANKVQFDSSVNIIHGIGLGLLSTIIPIIIIASNEFII